MAISRRDLMKEVLPELNRLFEEEYSQHPVADYNRIEMPRRGRYQVWQGHKMLADRIKHRREALAIMKLMEVSEDGNT